MSRSEYAALLGYCVRRVRLHRKMEAADAALALSISEGEYEQAELGSWDFSVSELFLLSVLLNFSLMDFSVYVNRVYCALGSADVRNIPEDQIQVALDRAAVYPLPRNAPLREKW